MGETTGGGASGRSPETLFNAAQKAFQAKRYDEAVTLCRQIGAGQPQHLGSRMLLANIAHLTGQPKLAESFLREALAIDAGCIEALVGLAALLAGEGDTAEAAELCHTAMQLRPDLGAPHFHLGRCRLRECRFEEAAACFEQSLAFTPDLATGRHHLGLALAQLGKFNEAEVSFRKAALLDPKSAVSEAELGNMLLAKGSKTEAIACFEQVALLQPGTPFGFLFLGRARMEEEKFAEAEAALCKAIAADPRLADAYVLLGRMLCQMGRFQEARAYLDKAIGLQPQRPDAYCAAVAGTRITEQERPIVQAMVAIAASGRLSQTDLKPLQYALGKAFDDLEEYAAAILHFDEANRISKDQLRSAGRAFNRAERSALFERTISTFTGEHFARFKESGSNSDKPIFIVGMPRSGTTLLEQILSSHSEVGAGGELGTWTALASAFRDGRAPSRQVLTALAGEFVARLEKAAPDCQRVTEKTPQNYILLGQILATFPNAHIIHCRRNPLDTCLSIYTTAFMAGPEYAHDRSDLVFAYREYLKLMKHWRSVLPTTRFIEVDYEELVADQAPFVRKLLGFLGLSWSEECLKHEVNAHPISTPSVWQARQPIFKRSIGRWRHYEPWLGDLRKLIEANDRESGA